MHSMTCLITYARCDIVCDLCLYAMCVFDTRCNLKWCDSTRATPQLLGREWVRTESIETDLKQPSPAFLELRSVSWETAFPWTGSREMALRWFKHIPSSFTGGSAGKESACSAGDLGLIPGLGGPPGEGKGSPLQCAGLENSMECTVHGVAKSWTGLSNFHLHFKHITSLVARQ